MEQSKLPMIELHLHLDGAIPPETMWALAQEKKIPMPAETLEDFRRWLVETSDCADVNTYLARFELPLQLMQDEKSIARVTKDLMTELSRQGHIYDEIRFAPQLHRREGLTQRQAIEAVLEGRRQALAENPGYDAGILLCAMCIGPETVNMAENLETVRLAKEFLGRGVVGADLAGAEGIVPLQSFHPVFDLARELGVPFLTFPAAELAAVPGQFSHSQKVLDVTGVGNVCERAAVLASGLGVLLRGKARYPGVTFALARRKFFDHTEKADPSMKNVSDTEAQA